MTLTKQQKECYQKFNELKVGALFMKQGTGKTRVAIELANSTDVQLVCFIVPHALKNNTKEEIDKWGLKKTYIIETYQGIAMSDVRYLKLLEELKDKSVMIICDESAFIKNDESKTYNRLIELAKYSDYRLILNGTPITKNEWDIYNQMYFLSPLILNMERYQFLNTFFKKIQYKKKGCKPNSFYKISEVNIEYLQKLIEPYTFYVDLQFDKQETHRTIHAYGGVDDEYYDLKEKLLISIEKGSDLIVRQLRIMEHLIFTDTERLDQIAPHIKGQSVVFCNFRKEIEYLSSKLDCYVIHGDVKNRTEIINQFKNDNKPLLIMLGIGAFGHNLQFCNKVYFSSITFDYGKIDQAMYRIKRLGQERDVEYVYFDSDYGLYNMIEDNLNNKQTLHDLIIEKLEVGNFGDSL